MLSLRLVDHVTFFTNHFSFMILSWILSSPSVRASESSAHSGAKRGAASTCPLDVRVVKHEPRLHQLALIIELRPVQMKDALRVEHDAGAVFLKDLVFCLGGINIHFVLKARASALDNFDTQPMSLFCPCEK